MCASHKKVKECLAFFFSSFPQMWICSSSWVIWYNTRNHGLLTKKSVKKTHVVFLPPCPISWKCHFEQVDYDMFVLIKSFWLVILTIFFIKFFSHVYFTNQMRQPYLSTNFFKLIFNWKKTQILFIYLFITYLSYFT